MTDSDNKITVMIGIETATRNEQVAMDHLKESADEMEEVTKSDIQVVKIEYDGWVHDDESVTYQWYGYLLMTPEWYEELKNEYGLFTDEDL